MPDRFTHRDVILVSADYCDPSIDREKTEIKDLAFYAAMLDESKLTLKEDAAPLRHRLARLSAKQAMRVSLQPATEQPLIALCLAYKGTVKDGVFEERIKDEDEFLEALRDTYGMDSMVLLGKWCLSLSTLPADSKGPFV